MRALRPAPTAYTAYLKACACLLAAYTTYLLRVGGYDGCALRALRPASTAYTAYLKASYLLRVGGYDGCALRADVAAAARARGHLPQYTPLIAP
jgi:hypothetical protein